MSFYMGTVRDTKVARVSMNISGLEIATSSFRDITLVPACLRPPEHVVVYLRRQAIREDQRSTGKRVN
jgi:hypothetical protein